MTRLFVTLSLLPLFNATPVTSFITRIREHDASSITVPFQSQLHPRPMRHHYCKMQTDPFDVPRPDPSILISAKTPDEQKLWVGGISGGLLASTAILVAILSAIENALPSGWFGTLGNIGAVPLGLIFAALGAAHFAKKETFTGIVPPIGTWGGLWQVPAPGAENLGLSYEDYHTYWTGACELLGGLLLAISGIGLVPEVVQQFDAFLLFLLTLAITPANIYMATHDAQMDGGPPPMAYPDAHIFRGAIQALLLADFWKLAFH